MVLYCNISFDCDKLTFHVMVEREVWEVMTETKMGEATTGKRHHIPRVENDVR